MSTDANDKAESKFPRASLRARNKTLMITPADIADFQTKSEKEDAHLSIIDDVFGDPLLGDEAVGESPSVASVSEKTETPVPLDSPDDTLTDDWADARKAVSGESVIEGIDALSDALGGDDIFAAPAEATVGPETLFGSLPTELAEETPTPIVNETRVVGEANVPRIEVSPELGREERAQSQHGTVAETTVAPKVLHQPVQELDAVDVPLADSDRNHEHIRWKKLSKLVGFLVSYGPDSAGRYVELREGRLLVTSEPSGSDSCFVIPHESVSPMHAIMRISADGGILILDQLSEHGTTIRRGESGKEESLMGDKSNLTHGDVVIFGECEYHVVVMGRAALTRES